MAINLNGDGLITVDGTSTTQGRVRLAEDTDNGTNYVELTAPASLASNVVLTMPGTTGTVALTTDIPAAYAGPQAQAFTGNGTFTIPTGITRVKVTVVGGGGGGMGYGSGSTAGNGGSSTVASGTQSITTITGGGGAGGNTGGSGGTGTNGDLNVQGSNDQGGGVGGFTLFSTGRARVYGGGGNGGSSCGISASAGAGGGTAIKWLTGLTPGNTLSVTIGAGGTVGPGSPAGTAGAAGVVIFEY